jgi:hypothetical protein
MAIPNPHPPLQTVVRGSLSAVAGTGTGCNSGARSGDAAGKYPHMRTVHPPALRPPSSPIATSLSSVPLLRALSHPPPSPPTTTTTTPHIKTHHPLPTPPKKHPSQKHSSHDHMDKIDGNVHKRDAKLHSPRERARDGENAMNSCSHTVMEWHELGCKGNMDGIFLPRAAVAVATCGARPSLPSDAKKPGLRVLFSFFLERGSETRSAVAPAGGGAGAAMAPCGGAWRYLGGGFGVPSQARGQVAPEPALGAGWRVRARQHATLRLPRFRFPSLIQWGRRFGFFSFLFFSPHLQTSSASSVASRRRQPWQISGGPRVVLCVAGAELVVVLALPYYLLCGVGGKVVHLEAEEMMRGASLRRVMGFCMPGLNCMCCDWTVALVFLSR